MAERDDEPSGVDQGFLDRLSRKAADAEARVEDAGPRIEVVPQDPRVEAMRGYFHASLAESGAGHFADAELSDLAADQYPVVFQRFLAGLDVGNPALAQLVLAGPCSRGKTHALAAFGNAAAELGKTVRFVNHLTYLEWLRPEGSDTPDWKIQKKYRECDVLLLNDLGAEFDKTRPASEFKRTHTLRLIDDRLYTPGKVTLYSTNETGATLTAMFGDRLLERLGERGNVLKFEGRNRRGPRLEF